MTLLHIESDINAMKRLKQLNLNAIKLMQFYRVNCPSFGCWQKCYIEMCPKNPFQQYKIGKYYLIYKISHYHDEKEQIQSYNKRQKLNNIQNNMIHVFEAMPIFRYS